MITLYSLILVGVSWSFFMWVVGYIMGARAIKNDGHLKNFVDVPIFGKVKIK